MKRRQVNLHVEPFTYQRSRTVRRILVAVILGFAVLPFVVLILMQH